MTKSTKAKKPNRQERAVAGNAAHAGKVAELDFLGQVISWQVGEGRRIPYVDVLAALVATGLDDKVAKEFRPATAFGRAIKEMSEKRIVRPVKRENAEDDGTIMFQFTAEQVREMDGSAVGDFDAELRYKREALMRLDKKSGVITSDNPELAAVAAKLLAEAMTVRTTADITRLVQKLFDANADLFPIRPQGGVYFVPQEHTPFVDQVGNFLGRIGGSIYRLDIPAGTKANDQSVTEFVSNGLENLIAEYHAAVEAFDVDTRADTLERAAHRIKLAQLKVTGYNHYLKDEQGRLQAALKDAQELLAKKIADAEAVQKQPGYKNPVMIEAGKKAAATKAARLKEKEPEAVGA